MANIGYVQKYINWYRQEFDQDLLEAARKEEERARKEADRVEKAEEKTAYEQARARLDVSIAVDRVYIQEKRLALLRTEVEEDQVTYADDIREAQVDVAELQEQKARLKLK